MGQNLSFLDACRYPSSMVQFDTDILGGPVGAGRALLPLDTLWALNALGALDALNALLTLDALLALRASWPLLPNFDDLDNFFFDGDINRIGH